MNECNGSPAEWNALAYIEGSLPEAEAERFEEHYFDCPACLESLQALQAARSGLEKMPPPVFEQPTRRKFLNWRTATWAIGSAAAALLVVFFAHRMLSGNPGEPSGRAQVTTPAAVPQPARPADAGKAARPADAGESAAKPMELADLSLPVFVAPNLRGVDERGWFQAGMKAYSAGDCAGTLKALNRVAVESRDGLAAEFYSGACRMHDGDLNGAAGTFRAVAEAGDSAQQEAAYYYLAQVELAENDAAAAHRALLKTVTLRGDLERKARAEDRKVLALIDGDRKAASPKSKIE